MPRTKKATPKPDAGGLILRAAALEFAERGFAGARVDEIARRAGVNKAMLYYHVGDKAKLYEKVILDAVSVRGGLLKEALAREATPEGKILAMARAVRDGGHRPALHAPGHDARDGHGWTGPPRPRHRGLREHHPDGGVDPQ